MPTIAIAYHSGFGHTGVIAKEIAEGARAAGVEAELHNVETLSDALWESLQKADAIVFGTPTYMANVSAPFKAFMDATSKLWFEQKWKDKLAAGFTNSGSLSGDKLATLQALSHFAGQHSMVWVSQGVWPSAYSGDGKGLNRLGSWLGMMAQSTNAPADETPGEEDKATARAFGERLAKATLRWAKA